EASPWIFVETTGERASYRRWQCGWQGGPIGVAFQNLRDRVRDRCAGECPAASEDLVKDAAERPDIGALVDVLTARLLWAHVRRRAEEDTLARCSNRHCW